MSRWKRWDRLTNPDVDLSWREKAVREQQAERAERERREEAQRKAQQVRRDREQGKK